MTYADIEELKKFIDSLWKEVGHSKNVNYIDAVNGSYNKALNDVLNYLEAS